MKKKIGNMNALYPLPVTVVAALVDGKVNFINISHVGILNAAPPHLIMLGMGRHHHTNSGIREQKTFSVNIMGPAQLIAADYVGMVSGAVTDKSSVFETFYGELKTAPIIKDCPVSMECRLRDIYDIKSHDVVIGEIVATYADEAMLTDGHIDLAKVNPLLFDMGSKKYWTIGAAAGDCWKDGKKYQK